MKIEGRIKIAFTLTIALFFASQTQAQEVKNYDQGFRLGFGINAGVPTDENV